MRCLNCLTENIALSAQTCPTCGMDLRTIWGNALPMGTLLNGGKYRIDWLLGRGGFGVTYRATHTALGSGVAIKEFFPRDLVHRNVGEAAVSIMPVSLSDYQRGLERFLKEGQVLSQLNQEHVVRVVDFFEENGTAYLVMELLEGKSLRAEMKQAGGKLPQDRVFMVVDDIVKALTATHAKSIWHCDIKPENVQILTDGRAVLMDFGAAHQGLGSQSTRAFTREYAAPEIEIGESLDARTDLFELGMMIHEMLVGRRPPMAIERMMKDTWNSSQLPNPWRKWLPPLLQLRRDQRPDSVVTWWKPRQAPKPRRLSIPYQAAVPSPVPQQVAVPNTSPAPSLRPAPRMYPAPAPQMPQAGQAATYVPPTVVPGPLRPAPRLPQPKRRVGKFQRLMIALTILTPLIVFLLMWAGIIPVNGRSYRTYNLGPSFSPTASAETKVDRATDRLERVIRDGQNEATFKRCITDGADINKADYKDSKGNSVTPLLYAIRKYGDASTVTLLAEKGAQVNTKNRQGEAPLHLAAELGQADAIPALLSAGAIINVKNDSGWTPLHVSAKYGQQAIARLLLSNQADINARSDYGGTPLHVAAFYGQTKLAALLLDKGANVNAADTAGSTPLHLAVNYGKDELAELFVGKGANINASNNDGDTPLHLAICKDHFDIVSLLLDNDAQVNLLNKAGETALHLIVKSDQQGLTQKIIAKGADVNIPDKDGDMPLHLAAYSGNVEIAKLLLDANARTDAVNESGATPLHVAAQQGNLDVAKLLLDRGANASLLDKSGQTPLQKAKNARMQDLILQYQSSDSDSSNDNNTNGQDSQDSDENQ